MNLMMLKWHVLQHVDRAVGIQRRAHRHFDVRSQHCLSCAKTEFGSLAILATLLGRVAAIYGCRSCFSFVVDCLILFCAYLVYGHNHSWLDCPVRHCVGAFLLSSLFVAAGGCGLVHVFVLSVLLRLDVHQRFFLCQVILVVCRSSVDLLELPNRAARVCISPNS